MIITKVEELVAQKLRHGNFRQVSRMLLNVDYSGRAVYGVYQKLLTCGQQTACGPSVIF